MRGHSSKRQIVISRTVTKRAMPPQRRHLRGASGQSMIEYTLIAVLVVTAIAAAIVLTGPAVGNIFSNTVYNVMGQNSAPYPTYSSNQIVNQYGTAMAKTLVPYTFQTNTPAAPTCNPNNTGGTPGLFRTSTPGNYIQC
jgi:Flp pilus assembly pilin Flp